MKVIIIMHVRHLDYQHILRFVMQKDSDLLCRWHLTCKNNKGIPRVVKQSHMKCTCQLNSLVVDSWTLGLADMPVKCTYSSLCAMCVCVCVCFECMHIYKCVNVCLSSMSTYNILQCPYSAYRFTIDTAA